MPDLPTSIDGMLAELQAQRDGRDRSPEAEAFMDQLHAHARHLATEVGLDLSDPTVARTVLRTVFAVSRLSEEIVQREFEPAWKAASGSSIAGRIGAHVKAVAIGRLAYAAVGALDVPTDVLPDLGEVDDG